MAHKVKCIYCHQTFDRDKYSFVQVSPRRYAHTECASKEQSRLKQEEADKIALEEYIIKLLGDDFITPRVRKQINTYIEQYQYTYSGIKKALVYFYEIKGNSTEKANGGIGIVPYVYKDAFNYYYSIWEANQKNQDKDVQEFVSKEKVIKIEPPKRNLRKRKLFAFLDEEEAESGE